MMKILATAILMSGSLLMSFSVDQFLNTHFNGGKKAFVEILQQHFQYPEDAQEACRIGQLKVELMIDGQGKVNKVTFLSAMGLGLESAVKKALQKTSGQWKTGQNRTLEFTIACQIDGGPKIKGDIPLMGTFSESNGNNYVESLCPTDNEVLKKLLLHLRSGRYEDANRWGEELLRRDPDSAHFQSLDRMIQSKRGQ